MKRKFAFILITIVLTLPVLPVKNIAGLWSGANFSVFLQNFSQLAFAQSTHTKKDPLIVHPLLRPDVWEAGQTGEIHFDLQLPPGFHAYQDQFIIEVKEPEGFLVGPTKLSPVKTWYDKFSKRDRQGMEEKAHIQAVLEAPANLDSNLKSIKFRFTYQACTDTYCLLPTDKIVRIVKINGIDSKKILKNIKLPEKIPFNLELGDVVKRKFIN
ncbi:MAG: protein-disulfide reductase DsbD domain-containing protein, partial [Bdellovibrionota bacterium]